MRNFHLKWKNWRESVNQRLLGLTMTTSLAKCSKVNEVGMQSKMSFDLRVQNNGTRQRRIHLIMDHKIRKQKKQWSPMNGANKGKIGETKFIDEGQPNLYFGIKHLKTSHGPITKFPAVV